MSPFVSLGRRAIALVAVLAVLRSHPWRGRKNLDKAGGLGIPRATLAVGSCR